MRPFPALCLLAIICFPISGACETEQIALNPEAQKISTDVPPTNLPGSVEQKPFRGFFGYLEFDVDPDAPEGVPGFGDLPPRSPEIAQIKGE